MLGVSFLRLTGVANAYQEMASNVSRVCDKGILTERIIRDCWEV
jgi:hypothetical protein